MLLEYHWWLLRADVLHWIPFVLYSDNDCLLRFSLLFWLLRVRPHPFERLFVTVLPSIIIPVIRVTTYVQVVERV